MVFAPPARAARATAPMQEIRPPPETKFQFLDAIPAPKSEASWICFSSIVGDEEQKTLMCIRLFYSEPIIRS